MTRRRTLAVLAVALGLLAALNALVYSLYRREQHVVHGTLDDRLTALGATAARWLAGGGDPAGLLAALVAENRLEDAYVLDPALRVTAGVRTSAGAPLNLLRVDEPRLSAAFEGRASVGPGYSVANARVEAAYFPAGGRVLALEAGAEYHAPAAGLRATYTVAVAITVLAAVVVAAGLLLALRAVERTRVAHGRAERLAAVGQMAAMVAHEVRNPLGILRGQVELARERLPAGAPARERERFAEMLAEIDRLNRLTEEFLGLARDAPLDRGEVDLGALAAQVAADARLAAQAPGARVEIVAPASPVLVDADADRLRQAIRNLALNALQVQEGRAEAGEGGAAISLEVAAEGERARLSVTDAGPGVPPEIAATLFEPFVTARPGGSGLGLAVARRVVERHGGTIALEPPPGARGARFSIYLPLRRPTRADPDRR